MKLLDLTQAEHAWLAPPLQGGEDVAARLQRALADTLRARLRCAVRVERVAAQAPAVAPVVPVWRIDDALAGLWLARRLGGRFAGGHPPFRPAGLQATLDTMLAERWLDRPDAAHPPDALAWRVVTGEATATLGLQLPRDAGMMVPWAQRIVAGRGA